jgi:hypothetical protein
MVGRLTDPHHGACLDHWKPRRRGQTPRGERLRAGIPRQHPSDIMTDMLVKF